MNSIIRLAGLQAVATPHVGPTHQKEQHGQQHEKQVQHIFAFYRSLPQHTEHGWPPQIILFSSVGGRA
jgi:hypothetical protein